MGNSPQQGQEKSYSRTRSRAISLVRFCIFTLEICVFYYVNSLEPVFQTGSNLVELLDSKPKFLRQGECGNSYIEPKPDLSSFLHDGQQGKGGVQRISSLAFGGRGVGMLHNAKDRKVAHVSFDQTKGFPGEGWSQKHPNFKIGTWNTRSMTKERF